MLAKDVSDINRYKTLSEEELLKELENAKKSLKRLNNLYVQKQTELYETQAERVFRLPDSKYWCDITPTIRKTIKKISKSISRERFHIELLIRHIIITHKGVPSNDRKRYAELSRQLRE